MTILLTFQSTLIAYLIQSAQPSPEPISALFVLGVTIAFLQTILIGLLSWLLKTAIVLKEKLNTVEVTLFGAKGGGGVQQEIMQYRISEDHQNRLLQRVVYRLGAIEDALDIPRNTNVGDTEDTELDTR